MAILFLFAVFFGLAACSKSGQKIVLKKQHLVTAEYIPIRSFDSVPPAELESILADFTAIFSKKCERITDEDQVSGNTALSDSLDLIVSAHKIEEAGLRKYLIQKWFDNSRVFALLALARAAAKDEAKMASLRQVAKNVAVFLLQAFCLKLPLENRHGHFCLEFLVRVGLKSKFYDLYLQSTFRYLTTDQKNNIIAAFLDSFDPNNDKCFRPLILSDDREFNFNLFTAWYQKLADCNFEGQKIDVHLANLTYSLLVYRSTVTNEYYQLLRLCMERVSIPILMSFELGHKMYLDRFTQLPEDLRRLFIDRFVNDETILEIDMEHRMAYGQLHCAFVNYNRDYLDSKAFTVLSVESQLKLANLLDEYNRLNKFVNDEKLFLQSEALKTPVSDWNEGQLIRAADDFDKIARNIQGIRSIDSTLRNGHAGIVYSIWRGWNVNYIPESRLILPYVKLLFALLCNKTCVLHMNRVIGNSVIQTLRAFNANLLPIIKADADLLASVRSCYPVLLFGLEFVAENGLFENSESAFTVLNETITGISERPGRDLAQLASLLLSKDFSFFEAALKVFSQNADFDSTPFFMALMQEHQNCGSGVDFLERIRLSEATKSLVNFDSSLSEAQVHFLQLMNI